MKEEEEVPAENVVAKIAPSKDAQPNKEEHKYKK